jgi:hypothetical protein
MDPPDAERNREDRCGDQRRLDDQQDEADQEDDPDELGDTGVEPHRQHHHVFAQ